MTVKELKEALKDMPEDNIIQIFNPYQNMPYEIEFVENGDEGTISENGYVFISII